VTATTSRPSILSEMADERIQAKLDAQVEAGRITQEQAYEYIEWYQSRPDNGIGIDQGNRAGGQGFFKRGFGHHGGVRPTASAPTTSDATSL
jgi:hypothetical protein